MRKRRRTAYEDAAKSKDWAHKEAAKPGHSAPKDAAKPKGKHQPLSATAQLRLDAERRMERRKGLGRRVSDDGARERLLHDLEVHRIELQLQNEELKVARLQIELALERYTELFEFAPLGYATLTREGVVREINLAAAALLGKPRSRVLGTRLSEYLKIEDRTRFDDFVRRLVVSEEKQHRTVDIRDRERGLIHLRVTASALEDGDAPILIALEDITELIRQEAALRDAARRKDEFLAVLSHELRNPLAPIRLSMSVLSHEGASKEQVRKAHQVIDRQVGHMTRLIDDLLDVNRIAQGKIRLQCSRVDFGELVCRTLEDYRPSFESSGIALEHAIEPGTHEMFVDAARLIQALSNLLANAEKFTPRGGTVTVSLHREQNALVLSVRDTGVGIAPHLLKQVLEPFVQAPQGMERSRGGLGLGLAMVKGIVELHRGRVRVESAGLGQGTRVSLFMPLSSAMAAEDMRQETPARQPSAVQPSAGQPSAGQPSAGQPSAGQPSAGQALAAGSRRVLVIDDNLDTADSLRDALVLDGHQVQVAYEGESGLALARSFHPEVVLCDLGLPGMDGFAVAEAFRADQELRQVRLIAVSGYGRAEDLEHAFRVGFDQHLVKPPRLDELERMIQGGGAKTPDPHQGPEGQLLH